VSDDQVLGLEKLSALHQSGELSEAEFEQAKRELLDRGEAAQTAQIAQPMPTALAVPAVSSSWEETVPPRRRSLPGGWVLPVIAMVVAGFVLGIALLIVAEVAPSSAQWTKGFVCASGQRLVTNGGVVHSNGGSAQGATHFYCAPGGQPVTGLEILSLPEQTGAVLGLSFGLGFLIGCVLVLIALAILRLRSRARTSAG
jgi:Short C-terminal domain